MSIGWQPQRPRQAAWPAQPDRLGLAGKLSHRSSSARACQYSFISCHCLVRKLCQLTSPVPLPRSLSTPQGEGVCRAWGRTLDQTQALAASQIGKSSKSSEVAKLLIFGLCTLDSGIPRKSHNIIRMCLEICLNSVRVFFCFEYLFVLQIKFNFINEAIWFLPYFVYFLCH